MEQSNTVLNDQLEHKYVDINITSVPDWNRFLLTSLILDSVINFIRLQVMMSHMLMKSKLKRNQYIDIKIGLPRGLDG